MNAGVYFKSKNVLITGASSGIGRALAIQISRYGARLILVGRNRDRLTDVAAQCGGAVRWVVGDLTDPTARHQLGDVIREEGVDIAILNAGIAEYELEDTLNPDEFRRIFDTNVHAVVECIGLVQQSLVSRNGHLVLMSSVAGYGGLPTAAAYCASKSAIRTLAQSLDLALRPQGVPVTCICPGFVKTPLTDLNRFPMPFIISVESAADRIVAGIAQKRHEVHFPKRFSLLLKFVTSLPAGLQYWLIRNATRPVPFNKIK